MNACVRLLRELIALPSINPAFAPPGDPRAGEYAVAGFVTASVARAGLEVELREVLPQRPNVLARLSPPGPIRQRVLLAPHLDTVGGDGVALFTPRSQGSRLFGRGACDTKGSVAVMISALASLARSGPRPQETEIVFAGLVDEEHGQAGSRALAASGFEADLAIVGEPTRTRVVTAHKGGLWLQLETRGKAAHGARPELGRSAVHPMARIVDLIETEYRRRLRRRRHPLLGYGTVSVGRITGGVQPNIVPDRCVIQVDRRSLPGETPRGVERELRGLLRGHGLVARIQDLRSVRCPALETDPRRPLVRRFMAAARQRRPVGVDYFCDAAVLARGGIPSVVFGPGDIAQAHTADEWVEVRQLVGATVILERFLRSLP